MRAARTQSLYHTRTGAHNVLDSLLSAVAVIVMAFCFSAISIYSIAKSSSRQYRFV